MPYDSVWLIWLPDGTAVVDEDVPDPAQETLGSALVQEGDVLLAIDGIPTRYTDLHFRFGPRGPTHSYDIRRGQDDFTVIIASGSPTALELFNLLLPAIVALEAWLVGFVIVLLARDQDHDAWHVGSVMLGFAVALAAAPAGGVGIPGARLAYGVLVPVMSIGYFEMALLPDRLRRRSSIVFRNLYGLAVVLAVGMLFEILILNPNASWVAMIGIRFEAFVLGLLALSILAAPITIAVRSWRQPSGYSRRQANILLLGTGVALLPFVLLSALPYAIATTTLLPVEVTLPLLGAIPATYAYVIYRHRILRLDLYAGRSILLVITALIIAVVFFSSQRVSQASPQMASIAPFVSMVSVLVAFAVVSQTTPRLKPAIDFLLYGPDRHFDQALQVITRELVANPQSRTLIRMLVEKVPATLEVRTAALFLPDHHGRLAFAGGAGNPALVVPDHKSLSDVQSVALFQSASPAPVFQRFPWARLAIPLRVNDMTTGLLVLGAKPSDDPFDYQEVAFVEQVADAAAIAGENVRLFEALQEMAEDRLRVRSAERMQLAHRLHDEPLQRTYTLAQGLEKVSAALSDDHQLANLISAQREEVRTLARELRDITAGLRPPILSQGLLLTLQQVVREFQANSPGIIVELVLASDDEPEISEQALDAAYYVVLEALANVGRHSGAQRTRVTLETMPDTIRICVSDDGRGTPLSSSSLPELVRNRHFGIAGMHEWADMAGGRLRMMAVSPSGTSIELHIPRVSSQPN